VVDVPSVSLGGGWNPAGTALPYFFVRKPATPLNKELLIVSTKAFICHVFMY